MSASNSGLVKGVLYFSIPKAPYAVRAQNRNLDIVNKSVTYLLLKMKMQNKIKVIVTNYLLMFALHAIIIIENILMDQLEQHGRPQVGCRSVWGIDLTKRIFFHRFGGTNDEV